MNLAGRFSTAVVLLLVAAYALPGLIGHEPWKPDEPYTFGVVLHMLQTGDAVVPKVGEQPFVEKPPLYYWVSSATAAAAAPLGLPLHDAARLASLAFVVASLAAVAAAARLCWGSGAGSLATLLFLGTLGLESHAQRMQVDLALLAGFALATLAFAACARGRKWAGLMLGAGVGVGFLGKGLFAPAVIGLAALLLPLFFAQWRSRYYLTQLAIALLTAAPALAVWPLALWSRSPALFREWFWDNNFGRFAGFSISRLGATAEHGEVAQAMGWFLFPLWAYAIAIVARQGRRAWHEPAMQIGIALALAGALALFTSASFRGVYLLPLVPPLVLVASARVHMPEEGFEKALGWLAIALGAATAIFLWAVWAQLVVTGRGPEWGFITRHLPLPFEMPVSIPALACAIALTAGFVALAAIRERLAFPGLTLWVAALALGWGLVHTLWLPWLDYAKSYRTLFGEVAKRLPRNVGCIVVDGPGESERAMVVYYLHATPRQRLVHEEDCGATLWMANAEKVNRPEWDGTWRKVWGGSRPGEKVERFELFVREPAR